MDSHQHISDPRMLDKRRDGMAQQAYPVQRKVLLG
jgi:hypothetical protein